MGRSHPRWWVLVLVALATVPPVGALGPVDGVPAVEPQHRYVITFSEPPGPSERADLAALGVAARHLRLAPLAVADLTASEAEAVRGRPYVERVDVEQPLERHLESSTRLVRAGVPSMAAAGLDVAGRGVAVAVVDTGVDARHPDLDGRVAANVRWTQGRWMDAPGDLDGHGTHVAGVVAGDGAASEGALAGVAPGASVVGVDFSERFTTATAVEAFDWVYLNHRELGIRVVVNAWGRAAGVARYDAGDPVMRAIDRLVDEGLVVVFSASNHGPSESTLSAEASHPRVVAVGATDDAGVVAHFSARGPAIGADGGEVAWVKPDVMAGGVDVLAARSRLAAGRLAAPALQARPAAPGAPGDASATDADYATLSGTSQAAPHVAGVAALMLEANPALGPHQVINLLRDSAVDLGPSGPDDTYGFGVVDAVEAVRLARGEPERGDGVLVAGGREATRASGEILPVEGESVQWEPYPALSRGRAASVAFPVKPGAVGVAFEFAWSPPDAAFRVVLQNDSTRLGPWTVAATEDGRAVIRGTPGGALAPGVWTLVAHGSAAEPVAWEAAVEVEVREQPERSALLAPEHRLPDGAYGPGEAAWHRLRYEAIRLRYEAQREWRALSAWAEEAPEWRELGALALQAAPGGPAPGVAALAAVAVVGVAAARRWRGEPGPPERGRGGAEDGAGSEAPGPPPGYE